MLPKMIFATHLCCFCIFERSISLETELREETTIVNCSRSTTMSNPIPGTLIKTNVNIISTKFSSLDFNISPQSNHINSDKELSLNLMNATDDVAEWDITNSFVPPLHALTNTYKYCLRNRKHVPCFYRVIQTRVQFTECKVGRTRNAVGTRAVVECFHSFFEFSQTFTSVCITR